jgi:hypothetical protein
MATALPAPGSKDAPKFWMEEVSGSLAAAIRDYLDNPNAMTLRQIADMRAYFRQWVGSPVWEFVPSDDTTPAAHKHLADLARLRNGVNAIRNGADIGNWLRLAVAMGMDPL